MSVKSFDGPELHVCMFVQNPATPDGRRFRQDKSETDWMVNKTADDKATPLCDTHAMKW